MSLCVCQPKYFPQPKLIAVQSLWTVDVKTAATHSLWASTEPELGLN